MNTPHIPRHIRAWVYGIALAGAAVATIYGLVTPTQADAWVALAAAILGLPNALALANLGNDQVTPDE